MKGFIKWTVIVLVLVTCILVATKFAKKEYNINAQEDIKTEMLQVQGKAKIILEKYRIDNSNILKGEKMEDNSLEEKYKITDITNFYKWTQDTLKEENISEPVIEENEYYLVNYETGEVVFSSGYIDKTGMIYYKLSDINNIGIQESKEGVEENDGQREDETEEAKGD